jgi:predicted ATP-grasp superfamily ATP-dependent carboligase
MGSKLREHPVKFGTATFAMSVHVPELVELSGKLISYFNYTGVCEIEFLKDKADNKYKLIEINARTWLWVGLAKACGVDYGLYIYNYLNGIDTKYPEEYENGVKWINCLTDTIYSIVAIGCRQLSMSKYIKSLKGKKVHALYLSGDIKPVFAYILLLFTFLRRR